MAAMETTQVVSGWDWSKGVKKHSFIYIYKDLQKTDTAVNLSRVASSMPCLVQKKFLQYLLHRIFGHIYETLNAVKKTNYTV